eukprot:GFUD01037447.1.p1 GENE.GFUD01037447.1~~GFUD01037447.1.p1  ORF type:complete len:328 (+),score=86.71 GFUD01037447.1:350-1333(+)
MFPSTFNGFAGPYLTYPPTSSTMSGDPYLGCSSMDYFSMLADSDLSLNIATITSRPVGEMSVLTARLRTDFNSKLGCIVHKKGKYKEATQVHAEFEKMLGLITFHHLLSSPVPGQADLLTLDQEMGSIWIQVPLLVEEAHAALTTRRANTAAIVFFVGLLNLLGAISGNLMIIFPLLKNGDIEAGLGPGGGIIEPRSVDEPIGDVDENPRFPNYLKHGEASLIAGMNGWGYGYYMTYFLFLEEADPGCGLVDLDDVYSRYQQLSSIEVLLSTGLRRSAVVRHLVREWRRELEVSLHCLLSVEEGNMLGDTLNMFVSLANTRLDITGT